MVSEIRRKVESVFAAALAARDDSAHSVPETFNLTRHCEGDDHVRQEVLSLLNHLDAAGASESVVDFLDPAELHGTRLAEQANADDAVLKEWGGEAIGQRVGGFAIVGKLGEGGMGV